MLSPRLMLSIGPWRGRLLYKIGHWRGPCQQIIDQYKNIYYQTKVLDPAALAVISSFDSVGALSPSRRRRCETGKPAGAPVKPRKRRPAGVWIGKGAGRVGCSWD
jgi:hypothetical protein